VLIPGVGVAACPPQETFSTAEGRREKRREARQRWDFTCLTVEQVARSYQVPLSWLGDALCNFGVMPPIQASALTS
jgi:hypothetical protein